MAVSTEICGYLYGLGASIHKRSQTSVISDIISKSSQWGTTGKSYTLCEFHKAAIEGNVLFLKTYNKKVIDVVDVHRMTPLLYAISCKHIQFITSLLEKGASPNFFTGKTTAFHFAALKGDVNAFSQLCTNGQPNFETLDSKGRTIIACAVASKNLDMLKYVMALNPKQICEATIISRKLLTYDNHLSSLMMECLLSKCLYPLGLMIRGHKTLLQVSIEENKSELAMVILTKMKSYKIAEFEPNPERCLISAVLKEEDEVVKSLIEYGVNPSIQEYGRPLLHLTVFHKSDKSRKAILDKYPDLINSVDQFGNSILHFAALTNSTNGIKSCITDLKFPINFVNNDGETPLMQLVKRKSDDFCTNFEYFMQNKAQLFVQNCRKQNIIHICTEYNNVQSLTELISSRDKKPILPLDQIRFLLSQKDIDDQTPLEYASKLTDTKCSSIISEYQQLPIFNSPITIKTLQQHQSNGYSPNVYNKAGVCLLVCVIYQKYDNPNKVVELVRKLMEMGADPSLKNSDGLSIIHHVITSHNLEIIKILVENGANFIVEPVISSFSREIGSDEISEYIKAPEKRASAINELLTTQENAVPILGCICKISEKFGTNPYIRTYMEEVKQMYRLLTLFIQRFEKIFQTLKPSTELGSFLLYFADAFLPFLHIATSYDKSINIIRATPLLSELLNLPSGYSKLTFDDALIVPTQQFTYYPELIKAIIKATPENHSDLINLRKAHAKFAYIVRIINEKKLIVESQKELQSEN
ncbi:serine/threonine-protein phosphatase 6 regulatory ankyrin repeat subunit A-like isoform X1 [Histomonas meleagridis]|uniref:serine/threonine-protein phosphatase 6 regulatory ankyrin repeat subunit A-like isoform X1 n=1 Tax=Histomonas meleagridis TaxID=135588 RepID=UPI00355992F3|nr:serine/threonine-protein phosphatase 6 regulatory ankyrin repeat subunit A-like isoform X1 [Histomonas meleagridis]